MRIVSLCPSNTELAGCLGLASSLVGIDNYSDWPPQVGELPRLGSDLDIDMDAVERLKPDLVLASLTVPGMERNIERLKERDLPYVTLNPRTLDDIGRNLLTLGEATGQEQAAQRAFDEYSGILHEYRERSKQAEHRPALYWEWWPKPVFTPGGGNWLTEISELAGARNVFADMPEASVKTDWDDVVSRNPDAVCMVWVGIATAKMKPELVRTRPGWERVAASQGERIYVLEEEFYCRPSPRLAIGLHKLAALLHPDVFPREQPRIGPES
ncbi:cobalamin-binding protein [Paenibacillus chartarius]|uniref:Cobalamin-binding protein n=1 Tax=Paenibacillus chartarius TaxID=747481 RepID=A0ABV6DLS1_9BACL